MSAHGRQSACLKWGNLNQAGAHVPILGPVIGEGFADALAARGEGGGAAFWGWGGAATPPLLRYLKVIAADNADDVAAETWVHIVRGLAKFRGDETAWRAWLFTTARRRA